MSNKCNYFSKEEIKVISAALLVFSYEVGAKVENAFLNDKKIDLQFSLADIEYVRDWFLKLYRKFEEEPESTEKIKIFLCENIYRIATTYTALTECSNNFKKYKVSNLGTIDRKALYSVLEMLRELFPELERLESI